MVFSSVTFLFFFLPAVLALYYCSGKHKNFLLLVASLFFYAWGEGIYLLVMLASIAVNYSCGRFIVTPRRGAKPSKSILSLAIIYNFAVLALFKYSNFFVENLNQFLGTLHLPAIQFNQVHLPIGISFFTFQAVSYLIDVYRGKVEPQKSLVSLGLYIALFPQLIAGPIVRYHDIAKALVKRRVSSEDFAQGVQRFIFGLSKKVLLANPLALVADKIFILPMSELTTPLAWLGAVCYTLQIYYDFSGYSDMAIGLGRMFGFRFLENFNYPYISKSIQEFWQRWHISLSSWLRDYLYIPLGGNRRGTLRTYCNLLTVFLICGLWHGASWTFICWGLYHGLFLIIERTPLGTFQKKLWSPLRYLLTLTIVIFGWVLFRSDSLGNALQFGIIMLGAAEEENRQLMSLYINNKLILELTVALILSTPLFQFIVQKKEQFMTTHIESRASTSYEIGFQLVRIGFLTHLTYFTVISLAAGAYNPFIYFRF